MPMPMPGCSYFSDAPGKNCFYFYGSELASRSSYRQVPAGVRLQASFFGPPRLCGSLPAVSRQAPGAHFVAIFSNFRVSKLHSKFCMEKTSQKVRKSWILASQSLPKTLSKSSANRCPKKHAIFHRLFLKKCFVARVPTLISYWFFQYKMALGHFSSRRFFYTFSV